MRDCSAARKTLLGRDSRERAITRPQFPCAYHPIEPLGAAFGSAWNQVQLSGTARPAAAAKQGKNANRNANKALTCVWNGIQKLMQTMMRMTMNRISTVLYLSSFMPKLH